MAGTTLNVPPAGVVFGNATVEFASALDLTNATVGLTAWTYSYNGTGEFNGPCNATGILNQTNGSYVPFDLSNVSLQNLSSNGGSVTLVCLNSVSDGNLNATWYYAHNGTSQITNSYNATNWVASDSYFNGTTANVSSCTNNWTYFHQFNSTFQSYIPCQTYFEMNNNTTYLSSFGAHVNSTGTGLDNTTLWSPGQTGYAPGDVIYALPVIFTNASVNGTYEVSVDIAGVTPVAQTFYFNDTIGNTAVKNDTVLFTFDMTAAWLMDLTLNQTGSPINASSPFIYGSIGTVSMIVTECVNAYQNGALQAVCPAATPS